MVEYLIRLFSHGTLWFWGHSFLNESWDIARVSRLCDVWTSSVLHSQVIDRVIFRWLLDLLGNNLLLHRLIFDGSSTSVVNVDIDWMLLVLLSLKIVIPFKVMLFLGGRLVRLLFLRYVIVWSVFNTSTCAIWSHLNTKYFLTAGGSFFLNSLCKGSQVLLRVGDAMLIVLEVRLRQRRDILYVLLALIVLKFSSRRSRWITRILESTWGLERGCYIMSLRVEVVFLDTLLMTSDALFKVCIFNLPSVGRLVPGFKCRLSSILPLLTSTSVSTLLNL